MPLEQKELLEVLKGRPTKNKQLISKAIQHESRLKLHSQVDISKYYASLAVTQFFNLAKDILNREKYASFLSLFQFPVATIPLTKRIYTALEKIFDGRNPVYNYDFSTPELEADFVNYRSTVLKLGKFWRHKGFEAMKTGINSIAVVDLPRDPLVGPPEPYVYLLPISKVIDLETAGDSDRIEWIIFEQEDDQLAVFDDRSFRIYQVEAGTKTQIKGEPIADNAHGLGYCPARFFWSTPIKTNEPIVKESPITAFLAKLDMLLFYEISKEHLHTYGRWSIVSVFKAECDFEGPNGEHCDGGFLRNSESLYIFDGQRNVKQCPVCARRRLEGAGSVIEIDPPSRLNDKADLRNPVQFISPDVVGLEYNDKDLVERKMEIYTGITGFQGLPINDQAVNEKQVFAIFESLEAALKYPQENFEEVMAWTDSTIARLRYETGFTSASISLGTEHYILTAKQLMDLYQAARTANMSSTILDSLEDKYYATEYRNNPEKLARQRILNHVDPLRHRTVSEVTGMYKDNQIRYEDYIAKVNFSSFVMRFERENAVVTEFGKELAFDIKVERIKAELARYAAEMKPEAKPEPDPVPAVV